jgi:hypothetical protein
LGAAILWAAGKKRGFCRLGSVGGGQQQRQLQLAKTTLFASGRAQCPLKAPQALSAKLNQRNWARRYFGRPAKSVVFAGSVALGPLFGTVASLPAQMDQRKSDRLLT